MCTKLVCTTRLVCVANLWNDNKQNSKWRKFMCSKWQNDIVLIFFKNPWGVVATTCEDQDIFFYYLNSFTMWESILLCVWSLAFFFPNSNYTKFYDNLNFIILFYFWSFFTITMLIVFIIILKLCIK